MEGRVAGGRILFCRELNRTGRLDTDFAEALRRSGMVDVVCVRCFRPFLTREPTELCPPCEGWGPSDLSVTESRACWSEFWRRSLLVALLRRGVSLAEGMPDDLDELRLETLAELIIEQAAQP